MLAITDAEVQELLTYEEYLLALEEGYRQHGVGRAGMRPRDNLMVPESNSSLKVIPGVMPALGVMGAHLYSGGYIMKQYPRRAVLLFDVGNGALLALINSETLCWLQTGATAALAAKHLARPESSVAAIIGSARQARSQLIMLSRVLDLKTTRVFSPTRGNRENFAAEMSALLGLTVEPVESASEAVQGADIVVTATNSKQPVLEAAWLAPGTHVNAIGAHYPDARELGSELIQRGKLVVDVREQALEECGELLIPMREGLVREDAIHAELGEIICGSKQGRETEQEITIFKSGGTGIDYLAVAGLIYSKALQNGLGQRIDL